MPSRYLEWSWGQQILRKLIPTIAILNIFYESRLKRQSSESTDPEVWPFGISQNLRVDFSRNANAMREARTVDRSVRSGVYWLLHPLVWLISKYILQKLSCGLIPRAYLPSLNTPQYSHLSTAGCGKSRNQMDPVSPRPHHQNPSKCFINVRQCNALQCTCNVRVIDPHTLYIIRDRRSQKLCDQRILEYLSFDLGSVRV